MDEVVKLLADGKRDVDALQRLRAQAEETRREMLQKYGVREIAVELIRERRDRE